MGSLCYQALLGCWHIFTHIVIGLRPANYASVKGGLGAQPPGYTAKIDLWHRGPSRAPVSQDISMAP